MVKKLISVFGIALGFAAVFVLLARADKPPKDKASVAAIEATAARMDLLTAARLDAAINKVQIGQQKMQALQEEFAPAVQTANEITARFKLRLWDENGQPFDRVNFETGEITRRQKPAPAVAQTNPPAPAPPAAKPEDKSAPKK